MLGCERGRLEGSFELVMDYFFTRLKNDLLSGIDLLQLRRPQIDDQFNAMFTLLVT